MTKVTDFDWPTNDVVYTLRDYAIIIGKKLNDGLVEIVDRKTLTKRDVLVEDAKEEMLKLR